VSLLGRLEDLSLTDIVQIVFLSRRTGILEIVDSRGRHTVMFRQGLVVNASAPDHPDLVTYLSKTGQIPAASVKDIRRMEDQGIPCATAVVDMQLLDDHGLASAIRRRIVSVVKPLLQSREGEFNFLLSDSMNPVDMEYDPSALFQDGGFPPQKILETATGEKLKPLQGLEDSLKAGKALVREQSTAPQKTQFKVAGGVVGVASPDAMHRNVVLFERNPLLRVAAKRAFTNAKVNISQFGSLEDARAAMTDLFRSNSFFVTFLELTPDGATLRLLQHIKGRNARLPVVIIDREVDLRRRHDLLRAGADLYVTKPTAERLQPGKVEEELALFAGELVLFAERAFQQWEQATGGGADAGKLFYETAGDENVDRSFSVLKQLINELSDPNDITLVAETILRFSAQSVDRAALFMVEGDEFAGVGGFGVTGGGEDMDSRVKMLRIARNEPSILSDVAESGQPHRGKIRRTPANQQLIDQLGGLLPTEVVAFPILHEMEVVGILYGDNAEHRAPIDNVAGLEIFLSQAGAAFGNAVFASTGRGREGV
jgi:CheY-like chemotaxis protein